MSATRVDCLQSLVTLGRLNFTHARRPSLPPSPRSNTFSYLLEYGLHTGSNVSGLIGFSLMADGRIGTDFSFCVRSASGSGVRLCLLMERVKLPWVVRVTADVAWL